MFAPLAVAYIYRDYSSPNTANEIYAFMASILLTLGAGFIMLLVTKGYSARMISVRDGFLMAAVGWIVVAFFSMMPFIFSGAIPNIVDAFFESMSGITTTGGSVLSDLDAMPRGVMFWRCMTQWIGGMGIIGLFVAILPAMGEGSHNLFRAEIPGGANFEKLTPRIRATARALWSMYVALTALEIFLLYAAGMPLFESFCHAFTNVSTGGFSTYSGSLGDVDSLAIRWIVIVFMVIGGISFTLHYRLLRGEGLGAYWKNEEFRLFVGLILVVAALITTDLFMTGNVEANLKETITSAVFQVTSIMTTTGFSSADYSTWSSFAQGALICLMFVGGCSGSTAGSIKVIRHLIASKAISSELKMMSNPREVVVARLQDHPLTDESLRNTLVFIALFISLFVFGGLFLALMGEDLLTAFSASIACLGNIGPGIGEVGPVLNYGGLHPLSKIVLTVEMLMGRLELFGFIIFFMALVGKRAK